LCRFRLNRLNNAAPALICDRRAFRE